MINKLIFYVLILILLFSCKTNKTARPWINQPTAVPFREYLTANKIIFDATNDSIYDTNHYTDFIKYEIKTNLEKNPYIKLNQVYSFYSETIAQTFGTIIEEGKQSVTFVIYADNGYFYLSTFDLRIIEFSIPENGKVKLLKPVVVQHLGSYELTNDFIKTRKHNKSYRQEWTDYLNGAIKNDTIHFTEQYVGQSVKFKKKWWAKKKKYNLIEIYQPNLKAVKFKNRYNLINFEVSGEFILTK